MRKYWPQIAVISLSVADVLEALVRDGEVMKYTTYNFWATLVAYAILAGLLGAGGFWKDRT